MTKNDGGPAFPVLTDRSGGEEFYLGTPGMSMRDWFAGQALAGIMANPVRWQDIKDRYDAGSISYEDASKSNAVKAYSIADAMLTARKETPND